ncbi:putative LRR receptor-like serine/threonine-protein kinase [Hordeum vulgare]|nr:putative LRR receptor-like serine/threonine-protein kinase [Hordeum vulgare]
MRSSAATGAVSGERELQKATSNFTKLLGQGAFGPVYKVDMSSDEILAVKVLANNSKQGEKEFQNEVLLLGRLHHRNLVNLVGYCAEKGQHILLYAYMPNGSLASHLYGENSAPLRWELRVNIALDVARGLEYLHDGVVPPVVHRDIKSSNILLDQSMHARSHYCLRDTEGVGGHGGWSSNHANLAPMGFIQSTFSLLVGAAGGIYMAQNYDVPNIKNYMQGLMGKAKELDVAYKKPEDGSKSKA